MDELPRTLLAIRPGDWAAWQCSHGVFDLTLLTLAGWS